MKPPAGGTTAREAIVTTRPRPAFTMWGITARVATNVLVRFMASMRSHVARSVSTSAPPAKPPTRVTRMSTCPCRATTESTNPVMAPRSVTSTTLVINRSPAATATRCASAVMSLGARDRHDGRALDVLVADLADLEVREAVAELAEGLLERGERLAGTRQRRGAGQHVVLHVGVIDAALLDLRHDDGQGLVGRPDERRPLLALLEAFRQRDLQELVDPPQDRREGAAREALVALVEQAQGDEVRGFELKRPLLLRAPGLPLRQPPIHPDHLERLLLQVVGLLDVQRQDLISDLGLDHQDRGQVLGLELREHRAPVVAVGRPVDAGARRQGDDGIHESVELLHRFGQALDVRRRQVTLIRARLHAIEGQEAEDLPVLADGVAIERQHVPAVSLDLLGERAGLARGLRRGKRRPAPSRHRRRQPAAWAGTRRRNSSRALP